MITELEKVGIIHLFTLGFRGEDLVNFKIVLNNPSKIAELQELEHWKQKFDISSSATEGFFSKRWLAKNLFNISEEEFVRNQREMFFDRKITAAMEFSGEQAQADLQASAGAPEGDELAGYGGED